MKYRTLQKRRRAATMLEVAVIIPLMVVLVAIAIDLTAGIYRYQQIATLARTGVRYAAVHAGQYAQETGQPVVTASTLKTASLLPMAVGLDAAKLDCTLTWLPSGNSYPYSISTNTGQIKQNMVRVTITYPWQPVFLFGTTIPLTSTSETTISY